jgi:hypothetical protein
MTRANMTWHMAESGIIKCITNSGAPIASLHVVLRSSLDCKKQLSRRCSQAISDQRPAHFVIGTMKISSSGRKQSICANMLAD